jgi:signal peptidase I
MESPTQKTGLFAARNASPNDTRETIKTLAIAIVLAVLFRSFVYEPFHIPSGSMKSNLLIGDYLFVSKFSYGYSRYSFPFGLLPFKGRMFATPPQRGDVVVFRPPGAPGTDYIKRLIGLPGDHIQMKDSVLYINDQAVPKEYVDDWTDADKNPSSVLKRFKETLPEGKSYLMLNEAIQSSVENTEVYVVPEGHYFMMGDNRDNSRDSRYASPVGFVPEENLIGRADLILFSWNGLLSLRTDRFFLKIP